MKKAFHRTISLRRNEVVNMSEKIKEVENKYIANTDYVLREIVGEYMLIPTGKLSMTANGVVTISESAAYLWKKMDEGKSMSQLCDLLLEEYEVDRDTALSDISEMIDGMLKTKAVKRRL